MITIFVLRRALSWNMYVMCAAGNMMKNRANRKAVSLRVRNGQMCRIILNVRCVWLGRISSRKINWFAPKIIARLFLIGSVLRLGKRSGYCYIVYDLFSLQVSYTSESRNFSRRLFGLSSFQIFSNSTTMIFFLNSIVLWVTATWDSAIM